MARDKPLPNVAGCAIGFGAAGSGVGSLVGMAAGPLLFPWPPEGQGTQHEQIMAMYGGTFWGIAVGLGIGMAVGVLYAVLARRRRLRGEG